MLVVLVHVRVKNEMLQEFERAILANADGARTKEPGCLRFDVNQKEGEPALWMFYEMYKDSAAFDAHRATPHFAAYQQVADRAVLTKTLTRYMTRN